MTEAEFDGWSDAEYAAATLALEHPDKRYEVRGTDLGWAVFEVGEDA